MCKNTELPRPHMAGGKDRQADNRNQGPVASEGSLGSTRGLGAVGKGHLIGAGARSKLGRSEGSQRPSRQVSGNADYTQNTAMTQSCLPLCLLQLLPLEVPLL